MQVYFGRASDDELNTSTDAVSRMYKAKDDFGEDAVYAYGIEYGSNNDGLDGVLVYDSLGRSMPIDVESIPEMILALQEVLVWQQKAEDALRILDTIQDARFEVPYSSHKPA